jgi:iron complex outermembrane receptor protein
VDAFIGGDMSYRAATTPNLTALALGGANGIYPLATRPYTIFNLRAGVDAGKWRVDAYAQNLFDKNYFTGSFAGGAMDGYRVLPSPRVIGVRAAVDF